MTLTEGKNVLKALTISFLNNECSTFRILLFPFRCFPSKAICWCIFYIIHICKPSRTKFNFKCQKNTKRENHVLILHISIFHEIISAKRVWCYIKLESLFFTLKCSQHILKVRNLITHFPSENMTNAYFDELLFWKIWFTNSVGSSWSIQTSYHQQQGIGKIL